MRDNLKKTSFKSEWNLFLLALMFYTRIRVKNVNYSNEKLNKAFRYYPLIGIVVALPSILVYYIFYLLTSIEVASILAISIMILMTGALHEDGFSDFLDGFGGGTSKDKILEIMRDHSVGAYGVIGLILLIVLKFACISSFPYDKIWLVFLSMHSASRIPPIFLVRHSSYARKTDDFGKAEHTRSGIDSSTFTIALVIGLLPLAFFSLPALVIFAVLAFFLVVFIKRYTEKKIGGFTGDVLGATEQISELLALVSCLIALFLNGLML